MTIALREARGDKVDVDAPDQSPRQIAPVVAWLCSEAGQGMSSQIWDVMQRLGRHHAAARGHQVVHQGRPLDAA